MFFSKIGATLSNFPILKYFPPLKWVIRKGLSNCINSTFTGKMHYLKGHNIYANNVSLGGTFFQDIGKIHIGEGTIFGYECMLLTSGYKDTNNLLINPIIKDIYIGKKCWITSRVIILGGVTIGDNVIIGAGSVVTKDIPSNCFAAGNPCKVIKKINN